MKIAVVGSGYVGLVAGACLAENGNEVICVDKDPAKIRALQRGKIPIYEPGLEELVRRNRNEKRLIFTTALERGVRTSQIVFIAVGTPTGEDGSADLQHVLAVARDTARAMNGYKVIVNKSTVPVGTAAKVREVIRRETTHPFSVVSNPEFLKQGAAIDDFMKPDRVVIGAEDPRGAELMKELYAPFTRTGAPIMLMDCASAELSQIRGERDAGDAHLVHERGRERLRGDRRRRRPGAAGGGVGSTHRVVVSVSGRRLRRQLLSEGREGDGPVRRGQELQVCDSRVGRGGERAAEAAPVDEDADALRIAEGQANRRVGPGVQAAHRRHARGAGGSAHSRHACRRARPSRPTIRKP